MNASRWPGVILLLLVLVLPWSAHSQPASPVPAVRVVASGAQRPDPFTPHVSPRALEYIRTQRGIGLGSVGWELLGLWLMLRTGISVRVRDALTNRLHLAPAEPGAAPPLRLVAAAYIRYSIAMAVWLLPFGLAGLAVEWRYGFSNESVGLYLLDEIKSILVGWIAIPLLAGLYLLMARSPRRWWVWMWALSGPLLFFAIFLQPLFVAPLFNQYTPLAPGPLRNEILALAAQAGIPHARVLVEDTSQRTTHVNAYVNGLGPSAQIVINDTALKSLPQDQILAMVGHEMGHYVEGHLWIGLVSGIAGAGFCLGLAPALLPWAERKLQMKGVRLRGMTDVASLPLLMLYLSVFMLVQDPAANTISRTLELRADAFGLRLTHLNDATARLMVGFAERDYSDPDPPALLHFWFGTHPTLSERIQFARTYGAKSAP